VKPDGRDLPPDPFADDVLEHGERLLVALVEAALAPQLAPLGRAFGALRDEDLRAVVLAQVLRLAGSIREDQEADRAAPRGRLRRAWRAAVEEWRR
jgi:hypothetical protein